MADNCTVKVRAWTFGDRFALTVMRVAFRFGWSISWPVFLLLNAGRFRATWRVIVVKSKVE